MHTNNEDIKIRRQYIFQFKINISPHVNRLKSFGHLVMGEILAGFSHTPVDKKAKCDIYMNRSFSRGKKGRPIETTVIENAEMQNGDIFPVF